MTWRIDYRRPGEAFHQVGSTFDDFELASSFYRYSVKGDDWRGVVRLVDSEGTTIMSTTHNPETP